MKEVFVPAKQRMRIIVNGKAAADPLLRPAINSTREDGHELEVRVTWEDGDAARYAREAVEAGLDVVIAAGGDGTVNEVVNGMMTADTAPMAALAVVPYGTANDFAGGIGIPTGDPVSTLRLAANTEPASIDVGRVNDRYFINVTSGGFGAEVTMNTPKELKKQLGGLAYSLMGVVTAAKMNPYPCRYTGPDGREHEGNMLLMSIGNGRQAGGGYQVTPKALFDDGLLDAMFVHDAEFTDFGNVLNEVLDVTKPTNRFVTYLQVPSFTLECERELALSVDGEAQRSKRFEFDLLPRALRCVLGDQAPLTTAESVDQA